MKRIGRYFTYIPRSVRVLLDIIIAAVLLSASYIALKMPIMSDEARFRMIEKENLVGPSEIIAELDIPFSNYAYMSVGYDKLIIGDDGDSVVFVSMLHGSDRTSSMDEKIICRKKTNGMLLVPLPSDTSYSLVYMGHTSGKTVIYTELLLITEKTDAVQARIRINLSDDKDINLNAFRYTESESRTGSSDSLPALFLFDLPVVYPDMVDDDEKQILEDLLKTNSVFSSGNRSFPAEIKLYDAEKNIIDSRSYVIQSRRYDANISR